MLNALKDKTKDISGPDLNIKQYCDLFVATLLEEFHIRTLDDTRQILIQEGYTCVFEDRPIIIRLKELILNAPTGNYKMYKTNVLECIKDSTLFSRKDFTTAGNLINFNNGYYDTNTDTFHKITEIIEVNENEKEKVFFYKIPHDYLEGEYNCPEFKKALGQWLEPNDKSLGQKRLVNDDDIFEGIGLCMGTETGLKKEFISYGKKDSAKTQLLNCINHIIGADNITSFTLHDILHSRFTTGFLQLKIFNGCGEISEGVIKKTSVFKQLTGDDSLVPAELKHGSCFNFKSFVKFWFNLNKFPKLFNVDDDAFFERFVLVEFPNVFSNERDDYKLEFWKEMLTKDEIQGIIHESIKGIKRLRERKGFREEIILNTKDKWLRKADSMYNFIKTYCEERKEYKELCEDVQEAYYNTSSTYLEHRSITTELQKFGITKRRLRKDGKLEYFYIGLKIKNRSNIIEEKKTEWQKDPLLQEVD